MHEWKDDGLYTEESKYYQTIRIVGVRNWNNFERLSLTSEERTIYIYIYVCIPSLQRQELHHSDDVFIHSSAPQLYLSVSFCLPPLL